MSDVTWVLPASGNKFVNQARFVNELVRCGCMPTRMLATSGGSIVSMLVLMCDIKSVKDKQTYIAFRERLGEVLADLDSAWYCSSRTCLPVVSFVQFMMDYSMFNRGNGAERMQAYTMNASLQPELWMGTHNRDTGKHQLWCTHEREISTITLEGAKYLSGNTKKIVEVAVASCAVPTFVPPVEIDGHKYRDGGVKYASPFGDCMHMFDTAISSGSIPYKIVYICSVWYSSSDDPKTAEIEDDDLQNKMRASFAGLISKLHIPERNNGIRAVGTTNVVKSKGRGPTALMRELAVQAEPTTKRSFIELAPCKAEYLNFVEMKRGEALDAFLRACEGDYYVRHWYVK